MKDYNRIALESSRPDISPADGVAFALEALYSDREHELDEEFVRNLTFEELIGILLVLRDHLERHTGSGCSEEE